MRSHNERVESAIPFVRNVRFLITGAGGFVGARLVASLARAGAEIVALSSSGPTQCHGVLHLVPHWSRTALATVLADLPAVDVVIHTAAKIDFAPAVPRDVYEANVETTELVTSWAKSVGSRSFVLFSSVAVYGRSDYGASKRLAEQIAFANFGAHAVCLRFAGIWGTERKPKLHVNRMLADARARRDLLLSDLGRARRNYVWVGNVGSIVAVALEHEGTFDVASPEVLTMRAMGESIAHVFGVALTTGNGGLERDDVVAGTLACPATTFVRALDVECAPREAP